MSDAAEERIATLARDWRCHVDREGVRGVVAYFELLLHWNARVNLTGARSLAELVEEHLPDSLALVRLVPPGSRVVDVGTGGGLPAVPFALLRQDCVTTLVEPRAKRAAFLATVQRLGNARLRVVRGHDSEVAEGEFDVAVSRATFDPVTWLGRAARLLAPRGRAVVFTASPAEAGYSGWVVEDAQSYRTGSGAPRWVEVLVPRETMAAAR